MEREEREGGTSEYPGCSIPDEEIRQQEQEEFEAQREELIRIAHFALHRLPQGEERKAVLGELDGLKRMSVGDPFSVDAITLLACKYQAGSRCASGQEADGQ